MGSHHDQQYVFSSGLQVNLKYLIYFSFRLSTYFSFCGNAVAREMIPSSFRIKNLVCYHWLLPVEADKYPTFKSWVLYGEQGSVNHSVDTNTMEPASESKSNSVLLESDDVISPVLMVWITLLSMYFVNCAADHLAVTVRFAYSFGMM